MFRRMTNLGILSMSACLVCLDCIVGCASDDPSKPNKDAGAADSDDTLGPGSCVFYVDKDAVSSSTDGQSWATAFTLIQDGIDAAHAAINGSEASDFDIATATDTDTDTDTDMDEDTDTDLSEEPPKGTCEVWVAGGVYELPPCSESLVLRPGVAVYGGFSGKEISLEGRDLAANPTVIDGSGIVGNIFQGASFAILDGFTLEHGGGLGECLDGTPSGGAIINMQASPTIRNCVFRNNSSLMGGAVHNIESSPLFENCIFTNNRAWLSQYYTSGMGQGGAVFNNRSNPVFVNCTFSGNHADLGGGAMYNDYESAPIIVNSIIWSNRIEGPATITYSDVEGGWPGEGNIDLDPLFRNPEEGDFHLQSANSPCVDAADGSQAPETDGLGRARFDDLNATNTGKGAPVPDMGALEHRYARCSDIAFHQCGSSGNVHRFDACAQEGEAVEICPTTNAFCHDRDAISAECLCTNHWSGNNCDVCPGNWDAAQDCDDCIGNFDAEKDCAACLGGWNGSACDQFCVRYVDVDATAGGDGLSWSTAFSRVQDGIDAAHAAATANGEEGSCQVWVAEGVYYLYETDREDAVRLRSRVHVYGGLSGGETSISERDLKAHPTVLDGHEGSQHENQVEDVVVGADDALLDGFTVTGAKLSGVNAWEGFPTIRNCEIVGNGAGEDFSAGVRGSGRFIDCTVRNNNGEGIVIEMSPEVSSLVLGCEISGNVEAGIIVCSPVVIENSTIAGNSGEIVFSWPLEGCLGGEALEMRNTVVWGNERPSSINYENNYENAKIDHSLIDGIVPENGNLNVDPLFVDAEGGDFRLQDGSPCIDAADGENSPELDLDGNPRVDHPDAPNVGIGPPWSDIGAYERQP